MTRKTFHRRAEILRTVVVVADQRRDGRLPMDVEGVVATFDDELDLLGALQLRWHTRLAGRVERELNGEPMDLAGAVVAAWHATADENPGLRAILDHYAEHPLDEQMAGVLAVSDRKQWTLLAVMAGQASLPVTSAGLRAGRDLEQHARATYVAAAAETVSAPVSILGRLRAALAA